MRNQFDIAAYSRHRQLVLLAEVNWVKESSEETAVLFRHDLISHQLLPQVPFFLLAYRNALFLWKEASRPDARPNFQAATRPVLKKYLGDLADSDTGPGPEGMESAVKLWLSDLASGIESPDARTDADKMLVDSGLYELIRHGEVHRDLH